MKRKHNFLIAIFLGFALVLSSCSEDDSVEILEPQIAMSIEENTQQLSVGDSLVFSAVNQNNAVYAEEWVLSNNPVALSSTYTFYAETSGDYELVYKASNEAGDFVYNYQIKVVPKAVDVAMLIKEQEIGFVVGDDGLEFSAVNQNNAVYEEKWSLGDNVVSNTNTYFFEPTLSGDYKLYYEASNATTTFNYEYTIHVAAKIRPITEASNAYVSQLIEYLPAPGQFINKNPGNIASAESIIGKKGSVTLGAWGGAVSYAFDHTVINNADEDDFIIYGNASSTFSEPGVIYVMQDENANGLADDTWYEIKGSAHAEEGTLRDYKVTYFRPETVEGDVAWEDNKGNTGVVLKSAFHKQAYYPEWITEDSYTISGTLLSDMNIDRSNPSMITSAPFDYGYADNTPGGDKINIADAVDEAGNAVHLSGIDFIKIQTGIQANMGWLGELSTEVAGVADLSLLN